MRMAGTGGPARCGRSTPTPTFARRPRRRWSALKRGGLGRSRGRTCIARWPPLTNAGSTRGQRRHLELWRASQRVNGAHLDDPGRDELGRLQGRASELASAIEAAFTDDLPVLELSRADIEGLPADVVDRLEPGAAPGTVRVPVDYQTRDAFLTHVRRRDLRERFWRRSTTAASRRRSNRCASCSTCGGRSRARRVRVVGGPADGDRRCGSVAAAEAILDDLAGPSRRAADAFIDACQATLDAELGGDGIQPWDQFRGSARYPLRSAPTPRRCARTSRSTPSPRACSALRGRCSGSGWRRWRAAWAGTRTSARSSWSMMRPVSCSGRACGIHGTGPGRWPARSGSWISSRRRRRGTMARFPPVESRCS